jgi:HK97 family phage major capsid protein
MDRKTLLATLKNLGADTKKIKNEKDAQAALTGLGYEQLEVAGQGVIDLAAAWKTVYITADAGEAIEVVQSEAEGASMEDPDAEREDEPMARSVQPKRANAREMLGKMNGASGFAGTSGKSVRDLALNSRKKSYDRAVQHGGLVKGARPVFNSADEAEQFGAAFRLATMKQPYPQMKRDQEIIGTKAGSTLDNNFAGALVVHETAPQIIDLLHEFGAARQLATVTSMPDGEYRVPRKTANVEFSYVAENGTIGAVNPTFDLVQLIANKMAGICTISNELFNDAAFSIADQVARSTVAGANKLEDQTYFLGTGLGNFNGLVGTLTGDADATFDAALSGSWNDFTVAHIQSWLGKIPVEAWRSGTVKIACSHQFYMTVLRRFAMSAGGNLGGSILDGIGGGFAYDGIPVVITQVLPAVYASGNDLVAFAGSFERGTKFGVVTGSEQLVGSDQRYFEYDQYAWRFTQRVAYNLHDVGGTSSEIIALID